MRLSCHRQTGWPELLALLVCLVDLVPVGVTAKIRQDCDTCKGIAQKFNEGIKKTAKSNFGGGNTHWEEKSLGTFAFSETRLIEIMENSCDAKECHLFLEENEELVEQWWFKVYAKGMDTNLTVWLCQRRLKVCCPEGTYGTECDECPGGSAQPCRGHGKCSGEGYRDGTGTCSCDAGYHGDVCADCKEGYYESEKNETHTVCSACHHSCKTGCRGEKAVECIDCKSGWLLEEGSGCTDVDECLSEEGPCSGNKYCSNTVGSYSCLACSLACSGCTGAGADRCVECAAKHYKQDESCKACHQACATSCTDNSALTCDSCGEGWTADIELGCKDVDECETNPCKDGEVCENADGTHYCNPCLPQCATCNGLGEDSCITCSEGYLMSGEPGKCQDVDECEGEARMCTHDHEVCLNNLGGYECGCEEGYKRSKNKCVKATKKTTSKKSSKSTADSGTCTTCKDIVDNFEKGMKQTENLNFGGGNTKWEEKKLGSYASSETRLVEIIEGLCDKGKQECHTMVERQEDNLERWWSKNIRDKTEQTPLFDYLCIHQAKVCCQQGVYGPTCTDCPGGSRNPCSGNGKCNGDGTRSGNGKCSCNTGYHGDLCNECSDGYFEESLLDKQLTCSACHDSCKSTCWEAGPKGCDECKDGWSQKEEAGCQDVDECNTEETPCSDNEYCLNTEGSFLCETCHGGCQGCIGPGPDNCVACRAGYDKADSKCEDVNECTIGEVCSGEHEKCLNTMGSYECYCAEGTHRNDEDSCVPNPPEEAATTEQPLVDQSDDSKDEL